MLKKLAKKKTAPIIVRERQAFWETCILGCKSLCSTETRDDFTVEAIVRVY